MEEIEKVETHSSFYFLPYFLQRADSINTNRSKSWPRRIKWLPGTPSHKTVRWTFIIWQSPQLTQKRHYFPNYEKNCDPYKKDNCRKRIVTAWGNTLHELCNIPEKVDASGCDLPSAKKPCSHSPPQMSNILRSFPVKASQNGIICWVVKTISSQDPNMIFYLFLTTLSSWCFPNQLLLTNVGILKSRRCRSIKRRRLWFQDQLRGSPIWSARAHLLFYAEPPSSRGNRRRNLDL